MKMFSFQNELFEVSLLEKFQAALGAMRLANGTSLVAALVAAMMVDLRQSRSEDGPDVIDALDDGAIIDLGENLLAALADDHEFTMPFGTTVRSVSAGSVRVGEEIWVTDAGRDGLFAMETVRRDAHGPNLELLRDTISQAVQHQPWRRIGLPSPAFIVDRDARYLLKFPPFAEAGGVVLQRWADDTEAERFCSATQEQVNALAKSMVADMKALWKRRHAIADQVKAVRRMADAEVAANPSGIAINAIAVDLEHQREQERLSFYVEYDAIDEALRPGIALDYIPAFIDGKMRPYWIALDNEGRRDRRDTLRLSGADGEIDAFAAAIIRHAPQGQEDILTRLATGYDTFITLAAGDGPVYATLFWRNGCIEAEVTAPGRFEQSGDMLEWYGAGLNKASVMALVGQSLSSVCPLPVDAACTIVAAVPLMSGGVRLQFRGERSLVNCSTGLIWDR